MFRSLFAGSLIGCSSQPGDGDSTGSGTPGPTVREVAFFQAVEVPVWQGGAEVAPADRNAPLIAGREAVVRVMVDVPAGWTPGEVELAVDLVVGGATRTFTAAETLTASSTDDPESGLVAAIPADAMVAGATWAVRLLEATEVRARIPAVDTAALDVLETGPLALRVVPFDVGGLVPDTSQPVLDGYRAALLATYPITEVEITVASVEPWTGPFDLTDINVRVGELQEQAMVAGEVGWNVYFYGMVMGAPTREEWEGVTGTSEDGGGGDVVRAYFAAGAAYGDQKSEDTLIHELGHVHGLDHSPCDGEDDLDPAFPYADGSIGVEGYDLRTDTFVPATTKDMMSYCFPRWISDYGYAKIAPHVVAAQDFPGFE